MAVLTLATVAEDPLTASVEIISMETPLDIEFKLHCVW